MDTQLIYGYDPLKYFLLSMLGMSFESFPNYFGCYIGEQSRRDLDGKIIVCLRMREKHLDNAFKSEITKLRGHSAFVEDYILPNNGNDKVMFVYNIPSKWEDDFDKLFKYEKGIWTLIDGGAPGVSSSYKNIVYNMFPDEKDILEEIFDD